MQNGLSWRGEHPGLKTADPRKRAKRQKVERYKSQLQNSRMAKAELALSSKWNGANRTKWETQTNLVEKQAPALYWS